MNFSLNKLDKLKEYSVLWPLATFYVISLGYITFFTYAAINHIWFAVPDTLQLISLGVLNIIFLGILFFVTRSGEQKIYHAILYTSVINLLFRDPKFIYIIATLYFSIYPIRSIIRKIQPVKSNNYSDNTSSIPFVIDIIFEILSLIIIFVLGYIWSIRNALAAFVIFFLLKVLERIMLNDRASIIRLIAISFVLPIMISAFFLGKHEYTMFGFSSEYTIVKTSDQEEHIGYLVYKNNTDIYIKTDSTYLSIPTRSINSIREIQEPDSLIELHDLSMKELFQ